MEPTGSKPAGVSRQPTSIRERRYSVRHRVHSPAYASLNAASPRAASDLSEIVDISEHGMSVQTMDAPEVGRSLNLSLDFSETKTRIPALGQVIWKDASGRAGIRFSKLAGQSLQQLKQWLFVNILSAYDHGRTYAFTGDGGGSGINGPSADAAPNEFAPTPPRSGYGGSTPVPVAIEKKMKLGGHDRETTLQMIAERALHATGATGAAIAVLQGAEMVCLASAGPDAPSLGSRLPVGSGFSGECLRTGRTLRCDDCETDERVDRNSCRALGLRSMLAVPLRAGNVGNRVAGLVEVFSSRPYAFNPQDTGLLQKLAADIVSVLGQGVEPRAGSGEVKAAVATTEPPPMEYRGPTEVLAGTLAAMKPSPHQRVSKVVLVAAALTLTFALAWLLAPWLSHPMRPANTKTAPPQEPRAVVPKPPEVAADSEININDLAGLRKLAEGGDPAAQFALGARYATGEGGQQDYPEAVHWFTLAAEQGHVISQATLGAYYWAGRGVPPDLTKAYFWSVLAQAGGDQASKYRVAVLTSRMSRSQVLAAQQQANEWLRNHQLSGAIPPSE